MRNLNPSSKSECHSCNLKEGEGETSEPYPRLSEPEFPTTLVVRREPEVPNINNVVKPCQGSEPHRHIILRIVPPDHKILEYYNQIFNQIENATTWTQTSTKEYPIVSPMANAPMKAIPLQNLPNFHGMGSEVLIHFFWVRCLCWGYVYTIAPQKLKLFPSTLKGATLCWFLGLGCGTITSWDQMKEVVLTKY